MVKWWIVFNGFLFSNLSTIGIITWYQARCLTSCCKGEWFSVRDLVRKGGSGKLKFIDGIAQYCVARIAQDLSLSSLPNQPIWMSFDGTSLFEVVLISFHYLPPWPPLLSYHPRAKELLHSILAAYCSAGAAAHAEEILFMSSEELGVEAPWSSKLTSLWTEQHVVAFNGMIWDQDLFQLKVNLFFCLILTFRWWMVLLDCRNLPDFIIFDHFSCYLVCLCSG